MKNLLLLVLALMTFNAEARTKSLYWNISKDSWTPAVEKDYQDFIYTFGRALKKGLCKNTDQCLRSAQANPKFYQKNPKRLKNIYSDCADFPYVLRAYYAFMNELPFAYTSSLVEARSLSPKLSDIRYSKFGNIITGKRYIRDGENINKVLQQIADTVSSASFRTDASKSEFGRNFRDTYPISLDRKALVPGTVVYDPNGHVAVVYDITSNGKVYLMDAHPDNSLSVITYGEKFSRSRIQIGGGFSNFRPLSLFNENIYAKKNDELDGFSLIQYQKDPFIYRGKVVTFYEYIRNTLASGDVIYKPLEEFKDSLIELCQDFLYRQEAVIAAIDNGIARKNHPPKLPANIYGTDGEWEAFATPARDARLKASVRQIKDFLTKVIFSFNHKIPNLDYDGLDLVSDLRAIYLNEARSCTIEVSPTIKLKMDALLKNLFALSFDPYHCKELRWGITLSNTCPDDALKLRWYEAEQGLRNRIDRDNTIRTDYTVYDLPNAPVSQVEMPDINFENLLGL